MATKLPDRVIRVGPLETPADVRRVIEEIAQTLNDLMKFLKEQTW